MGVYKISTKRGKVYKKTEVRTRFIGTKKESESWAKKHFLKGSYKIKRDKPFERKWKLRSRK